jgi:alpha-glucosidase
VSTENDARKCQVPGSWWRDGVLYQIYPRSFADSDGDGIGDLAGIRARLDHLQWLGVTGIWLNPTMPSPNDDWGYDVADYCDVHPDLGTLEDLDELVAAARGRGIRVLLDLVPNHTSDRHPWFRDALSGRDARYRDFYVWAAPAPDGGPPNNWVSNFGGSAWTLHEPTGEYYLSQFLPTQPDLNWWSEEVRERFDEIMRFWFDRGVAGFRIDVCHSIVKDRELRDDPPVTPSDHRELQSRKVKPVYSANRPELHDVLRRWRSLVNVQAGDDGDTPILVGETYVLELDELMPYYGTGRDQLHLAFNFLFVHADLDATQMREIVEGVEAGLPPDAWAVYTGSNHDAGRLATRWAGGDERRARLALMIVLTLRGTPFLYYGDEIALPDVPQDAETALDPVARRTGDAARNRDVCRTPMPWTAQAGGGFTTPEATPWLPFGDLAAHNVAAQKQDPASTLHLVRDLIALRRAQRDLSAGAYCTLQAPEGAWAYRRGDRFAVVVNLSDGGVRVDGVEGRVEVGTDRARDGEPVQGAIALAPWEGVVIALSSV